MDELTPEAKALLDRAKPEFSASEAQLERLRARLGDGPDGPDGSDGSDGSTSAKGRFYPVVVGALVVAGVLVLGAGVRSGRGASSEAVGAPLPTTDSMPEEVGVQMEARVHEPAGLLRPARRDVAEAVEATGAIEASAPASEEAARPRARRGLRPDPDPAPPAALEHEADGLAEQLRLIAASRLALKAGRLEDALEDALRYQTRFPAGAFVEEATALELLAQCGQDPSASVEHRARAYLANEHSGFASRVREACLPEATASKTQAPDIEDPLERASP